jgi:hypothetical protein
MSLLKFGHQNHKSSIPNGPKPLIPHDTTPQNIKFQFSCFFFFEMFKHEALMNFDSYNNVFDVWRRLNLRKN